MMKTSCLAMLVPAIGLALQPPTIYKNLFYLPPERAFAVPGDTYNLSFIISNSNAIALTGVSFTDNMPPGLVVNDPANLINNCGGTVVANPNTSTISLTGGQIPSADPMTGTPSLCDIGVILKVTNPFPPILGPPPILPVYATNSTGPVKTDQTPDGAPASVSLLVSYPVWLRHFPNLNAGDSAMNFTNPGREITSGGAPANVCANLYAFTPDEQMIACCSCTITPDALVSLKASDFIRNTLSISYPTAFTLKAVATVGTACNASNVSVSNLTPSFNAWGTALHALPTAPVTYGVTETAFAQAALSTPELARMTSFCGFIQANGSGYGICQSCRLGGY
jgi:uncharacterized repeat protein (TIGR01451 family)